MLASTTSRTLLDPGMSSFAPEQCNPQPCRFLRLSTAVEEGGLAAEEAITWLKGADPNSRTNNGLADSRTLIFERARNKNGDTILPISPEDVLTLINDVGFPNRFFMGELFYRRYAAYNLTPSGPCWFLRERNFSASTLYKEEDNLILTIVILRHTLAGLKKELIIKRCADMQRNWQHPLLCIVTLIDSALEEHGAVSRAMLSDCGKMHHTLGLSDRYASLGKRYHVSTGSANFADFLADLTSRRQQTIPYIGNVKILLTSIKTLRNSWQNKLIQSKHNSPEIDNVLNYQIALATDLCEKFSEADARFQAFILNLQIRIAQRDTELSLKLARTSAETALAAKRDSSSMKIIAVLTTLFLPPTFVATILSTPEYSDWLPGTMWRYWSISIPSTIIVMLGLAAWMKRLAVHERKLDAEARQIGFELLPMDSATPGTP